MAVGKHVMRSEMLSSIREGKLPVHIDGNRKYYVIHENQKVELTDKEAIEFDAPNSLSHRLERDIHHIVDVLEEEKQSFRLPKMFLNLWDKLMIHIGWTK